MFKKIKVISLPLFLSFLFLKSAFAVSTDAQLCFDSAMGRQPVLAEGRVTPLFSYTGRLLPALFPKKTCPTLSVTRLYCLLSLYGLSEVEKICSGPILLSVSHVEIKKILGLMRDAQGVSPERVKKNQDLLVRLYHEEKEKGQETSGVGKDLSGLLFRFQKLEEVLSGEDWKILDANREWVSVKKAGGAGLNLDEKKLRTIIFSSQSYLNQEEKSKLSFESIYERFKPFSIALWVAFFGFIFSILSIQSKRWILWAQGALGLVILLEGSGIVLRILISGRGPVTNMYETVMWAGFCSFTLSVILGFKLKKRGIWAAGFAGNAICLLMMSFATTMLDSSIQPLVPVLRDNFWLSTHVTSVTLSYSCFFLSWVIANFILLCWIFSKNRSKAWKTLQSWNYVIRISIQVGVVFLAAGVLLGGIWADYSWGRFWGWDPKETWSLIALMIYIVILHGKYVGWFKDFNFTLMAGVGFLFILMAWFGVNYILATGLHSYGFSSGGSLFLLTIFTVQLIILGSALLLHLKIEKASTQVSSQ